MHVDGEPGGVGSNLMGHLEHVGVGRLVECSTGGGAPAVVPGPFQPLTDTEFPGDLPDSGRALLACPHR